MDTKKQIEEGKAVLGIEFGSTRIKAVLIDENIRITILSNWYAFSRIILCQNCLPQA